MTDSRELADRPGPRDGRDRDESPGRSHAPAVAEPDHVAAPMGSHAIDGINVCGYLRSESGLGAAARSYLDAIRALRVPVALKDLSALAPNRARDSTVSNFDTEHPYTVNLICANADQHFAVLGHLGEPFFEHRYNIGVWFWEATNFSEEWLECFADYDELWAASSFIANILAPIAPIPVIRMPLVLTSRERGSRERGRRQLGVKDNEYVFLFVFDFGSCFERKNPLALIDAFRSVFAPDEPVRLIIKCVNEHTRPDAFTAMRDRAKGYPIAIHSGYWPVEQVRDLMAACDAYVSLHRSEGLGLTIADAMANGKPVIATEWSGNIDFMNVSNSFPVQFELVKLEDDVGPYRAGDTWADPKVEHAAELMRFLYENRAEAIARGEVARRCIESEYSVGPVAERIRQRLEVVASRRRAKFRGVSATSVVSVETAASIRPVATGLSGPTARLKRPVVPPLDLDSSLYGPVGRLGKRLISFLLGYHTYYQDNVNKNFAAFMRQAAVAHEELSATVDELAVRLDALDRRTRTADGGQPSPMATPSNGKRATDQDPAYVDASLTGSEDGPQRSAESVSDRAGSA